VEGIRLRRHSSSEGLFETPSRDTRSGMLKETLTGREETIARLVSKGATNAQIASEIGISEHTVRSHLRSIRRKWNVRNRVQMSVCYVRRDEDEARSTG